MHRERLAGWHVGRAWFTNVLLCLLGVGLVLLARQFVLEQSRFRIGFSGVSGWSDVLFVAAVAMVLTQPVNRATVWLVLGFASAMRAMVLFTDPYLSSDIYRYVWDGIVQHAHISPYRYVPGDAALKFLRAPNQDVFNGINRRDYAHTIYPPVAQIIYWLVTFFSPTVQAMKAAMFGFECVTAAALIALLRSMGRRSADVLLYAWCPLLVWEIGGSGHIDAAILAFVALALLFRYRERPVWTGLFLGLAVMTKFYPLVLLPALCSRRRDGRFEWRMPATVAVVCAAGYAIYSSAGRLVFGFLGGYAKEEGLDSGSRYFLRDFAVNRIGMHWLTADVYLALCAVVLGAICWWTWRHAWSERLGDSVRVERPTFVRAAMMLALAMMLLFSPHYGWYIAWLIPMFALVPNWVTLVYVCAFFYGFTTQWADPGPKMFLLNEWIYFAVGCAFVVQIVWQRWGVARWFACRGRTDAV